MTFNIIRHYGIPTEATTLNGKKIYRSEKIFIPEWGRFVMCAEYDNHFLYENPTKKQRGSTYMCTCGAAAVIVGYQVYRGNASPTSGSGVYPGELMVCHNHATFGVHADGSN